MVLPGGQFILAAPGLREPSNGIRLLVLAMSFLFKNLNPEFAG